MAEDHIIVLEGGRKRDRYSVQEGFEGRGPWYEGSEFGPSDLGKIRGHYFVNHHFTNGNGESSDTIVYIAHNKKELSDKIYASAVGYCQRRARAEKGKFINQTKRAAKKKRTVKKRSKKVA